jgi:hypothetical protein
LQFIVNFLTTFVIFFHLKLVKKLKAYYLLALPTYKTELVAIVCAGLSPDLCKDWLGEQAVSCCYFVGLRLGFGFGVEVKV